MENKAEQAKITQEIGAAAKDMAEVIKALNGRANEQAVKQALAGAKEALWPVDEGNAERFCEFCAHQLAKARVEQWSPATLEVARAMIKRAGKKVIKKLTLDLRLFKLGVEETGASAQEVAEMLISDALSSTEKIDQALKAAARINGVLSSRGSDKITFAQELAQKQSGWHEARESWLNGRRIIGGRGWWNKKIEKDIKTQLEKEFHICVKERDESASRSLCKAGFLMLEGAESKELCLKHKQAFGSAALSSEEVIVALSTGDDNTRRCAFAHLGEELIKTQEEESVFDALTEYAQSTGMSSKEVDQVCALAARLAKRETLQDAVGSPKGSTKGPNFLTYLKLAARGQKSEIRQGSIHEMLAELIEKGLRGSTMIKVGGKEQSFENYLKEKAGMLPYLAQLEKHEMQNHSGVVDPGVKKRAAL